MTYIDFKSESVKDNLTIALVSAETNKTMLENIPHRLIEDMALIYYINDDVLINNAMVEHLGINVDQLHNAAINNAARICPAEVRGLSEIVAEIENGLIIEKPEEELAYVATVPSRYHGAAVIAYPGFLENMAERLGCSFFILPSSINEVMLVLDKGQDIAEQKRAVEYINAAMLDSLEKLTDSVYHYSKENGFKKVTTN